MKVSLVVASGAHQGKVIQITGPQFLIGRDAQCHLRPASQAVSKHHCGILVRDGKVYVKDFGSTNGTFVNEELIRGMEVPAADGTSVKLGPLDFVVRIETRAPVTDGTPLPGAQTETDAALAAVKAATSGETKTPVRDATPNPARPAKKEGGSKEAPALSGSKEAAALKVAAATKGSKEAPKGSKEVPAASAPAAAAPTAPSPKPPETAAAASTNLNEAGDADDQMAAMLLGMDDEPGSVPDGSTVVELPAVDAQGNPIVPAAAKPDEKAKKPAQSREDMTSAASDLLRKMMRRPK